VEKKYRTKIGEYK
jgi:hypothetical protein